VVVVAAAVAVAVAVAVSFITICVLWDVSSGSCFYSVSCLTCDQPRGITDHLILAA